VGQFFTDFSEYSADQQPSGWTKRWNTDFPALVKQKAGTTGGKCLELGLPAAGWSLLTWDDVGSPVDVEMVMRVRCATTRLGACLAARASGAGGAEKAYFNYYVGDGYQSRLRKIVNGALTDLSVFGNYTFPANTFVMIKLKTRGTSIQTRQWSDGAQETATWNASATDTSIAAGGWVGIMPGGLGGLDIDFIGIGTDGDPAPTSPIIVPGGGRIRRANLRMMGLVV
jgi:hypothetical protein